MSKDAYGHLCTVTGALWRPDGRYFDGVDDSISVAASPVLRFGTSVFSVTGWFNCPDSTNVNSIIGNRDADNGYYVYLNGGAVCLYNRNTVHSVASSAVYDGEWHYFGATFNGASSIMMVDGSEDTNINTILDGEDLDDAGLNTYLGVRGSTAASYMTGSIGEVFIYSRVLTPLEIQHNYLATKWRYR